MSAVASLTSPIERAILILQRTQDGDHLALKHLYLLQCIINADPFTLTSANEAAFDDLFQQVSDGSYVYQKQWMYGIENLTRNHQGYILWRGKVIEHYSFNDTDRERAAAEELAARCRFLEQQGIPVSSRTTTDPVYSTAPANGPYLPLLYQLYTIARENDKAVGAIFNLTTGQARAMHFADGQLVCADFEDAFEAYHGCGFIRQNATCSGAFDTYAEVAALLTSGGFTPEGVLPFLV